MDSLIFQTSAIYWIGNWWYSLIIALSVGLIMLGYGVIREQYMKKKTETKLVPHYTPIDPIHPHYIEKTLRSLREYLEQLHRPHHTTAHTADEVTLYIENTGLSDIIHELEHHEYQGTCLTTEEKSVYNEKIKKVL